MFFLVSYLCGEDLRLPIDNARKYREEAFSVYTGGVSVLERMVLSIETKKGEREK